MNKKNSAAVKYRTIRAESLERYLGDRVCLISFIKNQVKGIYTGSLDLNKDGDFYLENAVYINHQNLYSKRVRQNRKIRINHGDSIRVDSISSMQDYVFLDESN